MGDRKNAFLFLECGINTGKTGEKIYQGIVITRRIIPLAIFLASITDIKPT